MRNCAAGFALEIQHRVHHVFEHARAGQRALLGDMPDEKQRHAGLLGEAHELRRRFAHLRDAARRRLENLGVHRLDGIHDDDLRALVLRAGDDLLNLILREQPQAIALEPETLRAQRDLVRRFLAADVKYLGSIADRGQRLDQQGGFADARVAADQHHRSDDEPAAQYAIELTDAGRDARDFFRRDLGQIARRHRRAVLASGARVGGGSHRGFVERIPGAARRTLADPFGRTRAALVAGENRFDLGHKSNKQD